jgi:hypothetical protein
MGWAFGKNVWWQDRKESIYGKPDERRKVGRRKLRWLDCIENDLKSTGVNRWRKKAEDRSAWANILKEALVRLQGLYAKEKEEDGLKYTKL